jgi:putative transposase
MDNSQFPVSIDPQPASEFVLQTDVLSLYLQLSTAEFMEQMLRQEKIRQNNRLYNPLVVIWLMVFQRLHGNVSMERAVANVVHGLPAEFWLRPCKRRRENQVSSNDGSYSAARQELPLRVVEQTADRVLEGLLAQTGGAAPVFGRRAFFVDGTSLRTPHRPDLKQKFPPSSNQHGESHWPVVKLLVAHDLQTGLALHPVWGAMSGTQAVSEQALFERLLREVVPAGAIAVGDINFGVFSVAYAADQRQHPVVLRMQNQRARAVLGGPLVDGIDREVEWRPSSVERKNHPDLPADACVRGRLVVTLVRPDNGADPFLLVLFTTLTATEASRDDLLEVYGKRWDIELDLRTLKRTLQLEQLSCTSPDMVAKEIHAAMIAYNLVRAVMYAAAAQSGLAPRRYSFARVRHILEHFLPFIAAAKTPEEAQALIDKMMYCVGQKKLRDRKRRPSYPRAVWGRPRTFPSRKVGS